MTAPAYAEAQLTSRAVSLPVDICRSASRNKGKGGLILSVPVGAKEDREGLDEGGQRRLHSHDRRIANESHRGIGGSGAQELGDPDQ